MKLINQEIKIIIEALRLYSSKELDNYNEKLQANQHKESYAHAANSTFSSLLIEKLEKKIK